MCHCKRKRPCSSLLCWTGRVGGGRLRGGGLGVVGFAGGESNQYFTTGRCAVRYRWALPTGQLAECVGGKHGPGEVLLQGAWRAARVGCRGGGVLDRGDGRGMMVALGRRLYAAGLDRPRPRTGVSMQCGLSMSVLELERIISGGGGSQTQTHRAT